VEKGTDIALNGTNPNELVTNEIGVVRGRDIVLGDGACHVLPNAAISLGEDCVIESQEERSECIEGDNTRRFVRRFGIRACSIFIEDSFDFFGG
jgi:hypothetical protein